MALIHIFRNQIEKIEFLLLISWISDLLNKMVEIFDLQKLSVRVGENCLNWDIVRNSI